MGLIEDELEDLKKLCVNRVRDSQLVTCVPAQVRIQVRCTEAKQLVMCFQFPRNYPHETILLELKSKTISSKLLDGLVRVCESEARKLLGRPQILPVAEFVRRFLDENPLCCCSDELSRVRAVVSECGGELRLRQKTSSASLTLRRKDYDLKASLEVPDDYPNQRVIITIHQCSLPSALRRWLLGQSEEIARTCVEPPLRQDLSKTPFQPQPSLEAVARFMIDEFSSFVQANCQQCRRPALPSESSQCIEDGGHDMHVERVYCGHLYHFGCLVQYLKTPPFSGGKKCISCGKRIFHDKYRISPQLAEARWAQEQARERELNEVVDFLS